VHNGDEVQMRSSQYSGDIALWWCDGGGAESALVIRSLALLFLCNFMMQV